MPTCEDLRLGGTLSGSGITGGLSINSTNIAVANWSNLFGHPGLSFTPVEVLGRPGGFLVGDGLNKARFPTLNLRIKSRAECDALLTAEEALLVNTDDFLTLLADPNGNYLEVDLPDGSSRFIRVYALNPAFIDQPGPLREISVPLYSPDPYWHAGGAEVSDSISAGADTVTVGGRVPVYDAVLVFAGDGTLSHDNLDWSLEVAGSTGAVTVDLGARTVMQAGIPADQLFTPLGRVWAWFVPGANPTTSTVGVTVTYRTQYN
jgi:hypothetical protein